MKTSQTISSIPTSPRPRRSLKTKLLVSHLTGILLAVLFGAVVSHQVMQASLFKLQRDKLEIAAGLTARQISQFLEERQQLLAWLDLEDYHRNYRDLVLAKRLADLKESFPVMSYMNKQGREELKVVRGDIATPAAEPIDPLLFQRSLAQPNKVIIGPQLLHLDPEGPALQLAITRIGYFGDEYLGTILAALPLAAMNHFFHLTATEPLYLADSQGTILLPRQAAGRHIEPLAALRPADARALQGFGEVLISGQENFTLAAPVELLSLSVLATLPRERFVEPLHRLSSWILVKAALALLVGIVLALTLTRRLSRNLAELQKHTRRVAGGDYRQRLTIRSGDELETLAGSFNQMTSEIQKAQDARDSLTRILQSIMDPLLITDPGGRVIKLNQSALRLLDCAEEELLLQPLHRFFHEPQECVRSGELKEFLTAGPIIDCETTLKSAPGRLVPVLFSCSLIDPENPAASGLVAILKDITNRKQIEKKIAHLAFRDTLTGLPNRHALQQYLSDSLHRLQAAGDSLFLLFLDLDDFKVVNDTLGHTAGDQLLQAATGRLQECVRKTDLVSRQGGDEFILLLEQVSSPEEASLVAAKIMQALSRPFFIDHHEFVLSASIGIASFPTDGRTGEALLKKADIALYKAKEHGKNGYCFFSADLQEHITERLLLGQDLREALRNEEFILYFQQKVSGTDGTISGIEALVRWQHPEKGLVPPGSFIPVAEETGLIIPLGNWILRQACLQNKQWQDAGLPPRCMAVNISSRQFTPDFADTVERILRETGLDPCWLELEITENTLMENLESTRDTLLRFKSLGARIAIDDFGMGYSSLNYLSQFPIDRIKIDRAFVQDIGTGTKIAEAIIALAHGLQLQVTAEGVETEEQAAILRADNCDELQGFLFGRPVGAGQFASLLTAEEETCRIAQA